MRELIGALLLPLLLLPGPATSSPSSGQLRSTFEQFVARQSFPERGPPPPPPFRANCSVPICEGPLSPLFCTGPLLSSAWFFGVQGQCPGSKLRDEPNAVMANFQSILRNGTIRRGDFLQFCDENFENTPYLRPSNLTDWTPRPAIFERIFDRKMKKFADALHQIWPSLTREFVGDVRVHQDRYPVLHVPSRFVVPGGLFKVYFYWDTFWILKGLHFSNLLETALGMLRNFAHTLKLHGFIPNSGNIQLSRRSQPPLFTQMVSDHYALTGNKSFLAEFLPHAEQELAWWRANRSTMFQFGGQEHAMYQYKALTDCPRPENLLEDFELGKQADDPRFFWSSMASACESGLDFSSRWYKWGTSGAQMQRTAIATNDVLPVDLNVFMALNYRALAKLFGEQMGDQGKAGKYQAIYEKLVTSIDRVCFDPKLGAWFDFDLAKRKLRTKFYPSNVYPLMLAEGAEAKCKGVLEYLKGSGALGFSGGVPSSLEHNSNEQWDFPNGWAPQQHLFVVSLLECSHNPEAAELARSVADAFLTTAFNGLFSPTQGKPAQMWEKYDVRYGDGRSGFGGEYPPQSGFGWSNGVVLEFIRMFYTEPGELPKRNGRNLDGRLFALESLSGFLQSLDRFQ